MDHNGRVRATCHKPFTRVIDRNNEIAYVKRAAPDAEIRNITKDSQ